VGDTRRTVDYFRGEFIPASIKTKMDLIRYVLLRHRANDPISNGEFVYDLRCARFGGYLHTLRDEGWVIQTVQGKKHGHFVYYLVSHPADEVETAQLRLVADNATN
tara:strand:- start:10318 stop:10635 length:318 start_codon:yes stop_codon:yes gene_type:complete